MAAPPAARRPSFAIGGFTQDDLSVITMLAASVVSAVVVAYVRDHFRIAIALSLAGYSLAAVYAFMGAPNVTVVARGVVVKNPDDGSATRLRLCDHL